MQTHSFLFLFLAFHCLLFSTYSFLFVSNGSSLIFFFSSLCVCVYVRMNLFLFLSLSLFSLFPFYTERTPVGACVCCRSSRVYFSYLVRPFSPSVFIFILFTRSMSVIVGRSLYRKRSSSFSNRSTEGPQRDNAQRRLNIPLGRSMAVLSLFFLLQPSSATSSPCSLFPYSFASFLHISFLFSFSLVIFSFFEYIYFVSVVAEGRREKLKKETGRKKIEREREDLLSLSIQNVTMEGCLPSRESK